MKRNNKKGFTIVELVIVIAVIAILSAVLIPTFGTVIADANAVAAKQDARNGYLAKYAEDIKDGSVDGQNSSVTPAVTLTNENYKLVDSKYVYVVTGKDGKTYTFDGTTYTVADPAT